MVEIRVVFVEVILKRGDFDEQSIRKSKFDTTILHI